MDLIKTLKDLGISTHHVYVDTFNNEWRVYPDDPEPGVPYKVTMEWESIVVDCIDGTVNISADPDDVEDTSLKEVTRVIKKIYDGLCEAYNIE